MALGTQAAAILIALVAHQGTITFTETGVSFKSLSYEYKDIQRLELMPTEIRLRTYEDRKWRLGQDREYVFNRIPPGETAKLYTLLSTRLDQPLIARVLQPVSALEWQAPAKILHRTGGTNGEFKIGTDLIVFEGPESRTWRYTDLVNVSCSNPFELSLTSLDGETRFQLKKALPEDRYNKLWRRVMETSHHD